MQAELEEVLLLQEEWSADNSDAMKRRGVIIRSELPTAIRGLLPSLLVDTAFQDAAVEGRDGTGLKTEIPWVRVYSASRSPSATTGWYVVYLFSAFGDRLYVSLNQGTTRWEGGEFKPRPREELAARVVWARALLDLPADTDPVLDISLEARRSNLGRQYELGNVISFSYELDSIPGEGDLEADLRAMVGWLDLIYAAEANDLNVPGEPPAELADALVAIRQAAGSGRRSGQGFRLDTAEKLAIERHAVAAVSQHYREQGYRVSDVGSTQPFDLDIKRGSENLSVEVKGTSSPGSEVILTVGEVKHHRQCYPNNALAIVHSIKLDRRGPSPIASGGTLEITSPWQIADSDLSPMAFKYSTGL